MPGLNALISGGAGLLGGALNAWSQANQNKKSEQFSREMFALQNQTNLQNWRMQNEYNSPQAQMKRFQEAGLNPNLMYGQGNSGPAPSVPTADVQNPQFRSPEWGNAISSGGLGYINAIYDLDIKQAQIDNLKAQNSVIHQDALLKAAQTGYTGTNDQRARFGLDFETEMRGVSADARREQLRQTKTSTDVLLNRDAREAALNSSSVMEAAERMLTMREQRRGFSLDRSNKAASTAQIRKQIELMDKDGLTKDLDNALRKKGINPQDPMWARLVGRFLEDTFAPGGDGKSLPSLGSSIWKWIIGD